jgi:hypothetical protein
LNLNCIQTAATQDCSGGPPVSPRLTAVLAPSPSPAPHRRLAPPATRPPPRHATIKASAADRRPFLPPTSPLYLLSAPPSSLKLTGAPPPLKKRRRATTIFCPLPVSAALEALPAKWPCPSSSSLPLMLQDPAAIAKAHRSTTALEETPSRRPICHLIIARPP